jgi:hypothetical protein
LRTLKGFGLDCLDVSQFLSAHFYEYEHQSDLQSIDALDPADLELILGHDDVQLWTSDSLYQLISHRFGQDFRSLNPCK